jgi:Family of unknown function (DUF5318)
LAGKLAQVSTARERLVPRDVVDFALKRHAILGEVRSGRVRPAEVCDAQAYLKLAARNYGEPAQSACPICAGPGLRRVHYVYGDKLGTVAGQAKHPSELVALAARFSDFRVYLVEVCDDCSWNHLIRTFVLGRDDPNNPSIPNAADG